MVTSRWNPVLVSLHWLIAILVILGLAFGLLVLEPMPNDAAKLDPLRVHMIAGITIGVLMVLRLVVRFVTRRPAKADSVHPVFNFLRASVHFLFYVVVFSMISTGLGIALTAGLPEILFGGSGVPLPESFDAFPPRVGHEFFAKVLATLIVIHVLAALYHQFVLKDRLLSRMWYGKRN